MKLQQKLKRNISSKPSEIRQVFVTAFQHSWREKFEFEAAQLREIFGGELIEIHHIGSTSIPGMDAKPIIDILMEVQDIQKIDTFNEKMQCAGYIPKGEYGIPGRRFFIKGDEPHHTHHIHVFQKGHADIARHIDFRDYLIAHPEEASKYARLKHELAGRHHLDIESYQAGKKQFIKRVDQKAKEWRKG
jgi:GrpB-like predicted nucleotidyltransferase (UPF0157 family)